MIGRHLLEMFLALHFTNHIHSTILVFRTFSVSLATNGQFPYRWALHLVFETSDSAIDRINYYPPVKLGNQLRYPLDRDLSGEYSASLIHLQNNWALESIVSVSFRVSGSVPSLARERLQSDQGTFVSQGYLKYRPDATQYHIIIIIIIIGGARMALLCSETFFSGYSGFPLSLKTMQHFQNPIRSGTHGHVSTSS